MRTLLISEGAHELGGSLETLVRRLLNREMNCDHLNIRDEALRMHGGRGPRLFKRGVRCLYLAVERGYDAVVVSVDEDGDTSRRGQFAQAQEFDRIAIPRAFGIQVKTYDAVWLADEVALSVVLGYTVPKQPDPETIRDPKGVCARLLSRSTRSMPPSQMYLELAATIDLSVLETRCPKSFSEFADRVRTL